MGKILFVSGSYFPYASANAACVKKFEDELRRRGHSVYYCNRKHDLFERDRYTTADGTILETVGKNSDLFFQTLEKIKSLDLPNQMGIAFRFSLVVYRIFMRFLHLFHTSSHLRENAHQHYIRKYADKIYDMILREKIEIVISVSMPFDSHLAVLQAQQRLSQCDRPRWIAYNIDALWSKAGVAEKLGKSLRQQELEILKECDHILFLDCITKDYSGEEYDFCRKKISDLPLPLFDLRVKTYYDDGIQKSTAKKDLVFAGTIYDDYCDINALLKALGEIKFPWHMHFMGKIAPKALEKILIFKKQYPEQISVYGCMPYEFAKGSMQKADILVNLANDNSNQIPSKIFDYMLCLKPILNIYRQADDWGTFYLKKYPLAYNYCAKDAALPEYRNAFASWQNNLENKIITQDELIELFQDITTDRVTQKFAALVEELLPRI